MAATVRNTPSRVSFIKPMLATLVAEPFDKEGWLFEIKWDGYRAIAEMQKRLVRLYSRNQKSFVEDYPILVEALKHVKGPAVLDGEIVVVDEKGRPSFQLMQNYRCTGLGELRYYVFDLLSYRGENFKRKPLWMRKQQLRKMLKEHKLLYYSDHVETQGVEYFKAASAMNMEGIIAKEANSYYEEGIRSKSWLKIKLQKVQEAVIGGFTKPTGNRHRFGALVLGYYQNGKLIYAGHTGGGFDEDELETVFHKLKPLIQKDCPFSTRPKTNTPATWVSPKLVCQVRFQEWTSDGRMRHPIFLGLRIDKAPTDVKREVPE
ncbi:MAG: non-homologous end-joining DNA ligase [Gemmatales bacterium]